MLFQFLSMFFQFRFDQKNNPMHVVSVPFHVISHPSYVVSIPAIALKPAPCLGLRGSVYLLNYHQKWSAHAFLKHRQYFTLSANLKRKGPFVTEAFEIYSYMKFISSLWEIVMFDFDAWSELSKTDPAAFELKKREALLSLVAEAPAKNREQLTSLVDALCAPQDGTPLEKALKAQNLMLSSLMDLQSKSLQLMAMYHGDAVSEDPARKFSRLEPVLDGTKN